ncbi:hypothetical protein [Microbacterium sp. NPDC087589]|uniref:hypothetical protein n=1 Tax=Microbacterium sp. NPDC087589 TaxID=3364191 RepID=UPI0038024C44
MRQTKDQQIKDVVVGVAIGVLAQGVTAVTSSKLTLEFAFNHAWRSWPQAYRFPSIGGHDPGNMFWIGMGKSEGRQVACAAWSEERWAVPYIRYDGWSVEDALEHHASPEVSAEDWEELGRLFVSQLSEHEMIRE